MATLYQFLSIHVAIAQSQRKFSSASSFSSSSSIFWLFDYEDEDDEEDDLVAAHRARVIRKPS